jgi:RNA polymerase sigma-70 factor, ECF subfamily
MTTAVPEPSPGEVTRLLRKMRKGDKDAEARLIPLVYEELRKIARAYMRRESPDHTLQPTALVNEAYLRLAGQRVEWRNRTQFFAVAAQLMRRILVDHARAYLTGKRNGARQAMPLEEAITFSTEQSAQLLALDAALLLLEQLDARQGRIVELRFFVGMSVEETAEALGIAPRTVKRDWNVAKAWLYNEVAGAR